MVSICSSLGCNTMCIMCVFMPADVRQHWALCLAAEAGLLLSLYEQSVTWILMLVCDLSTIFFQREGWYSTIEQADKGWEKKVCSLHVTHPLLISDEQPVCSTRGPDPDLHQCIWLGAMFAYKAEGKHVFNCEGKRSTERITTQRQEEL